MADTHPNFEALGYGGNPWRLLRHSCLAADDEPSLHRRGSPTAAGSRAPEVATLSPLVTGETAGDRHSFYASKDWPARQRRAPHHQHVFQRADVPDTDRPCAP
jgi:hypothetical protein